MSSSREHPSPAARMVSPSTLTGTSPSRMSGLGRSPSHTASGDIFEVHGRESSLGYRDDVAARPGRHRCTSRRRVRPAVSGGPPGRPGQRHRRAALQQSSGRHRGRQPRRCSMLGPENGLYDDSNPQAASGSLGSSWVASRAARSTPSTSDPTACSMRPGRRPAPIEPVNDLDTGEGDAGSRRAGVPGRGRVRFAGPDALPSTRRRARYPGGPGDRLDAETLAQLAVGLDNLVFDGSSGPAVRLERGRWTLNHRGATRRQHAVVSPGGMTAPAGIAVMGDTLLVAEPQAILDSTA